MLVKLPAMTNQTAGGWSDRESLPAGLEYMHRRNFVYRDLKPENVFLHHSGHCKLGDLGFVKKLAPGDHTYTTCGTADYMAPEVMLARGYGRSADYWAFGE